MITGQPIKKPVVQCAHCGGTKTKFERMAFIGNGQTDLADFECRDCAESTRVLWVEYEQARKSLSQAEQG